MMIQNKIFPKSSMQGFMLVAVMIGLALIAVIALLSNRESLMGVKQASDQLDIEQVKYTAQAGLNLRTKELEQDTDCTAYSVTGSGAINGQSFTAAVTPDNGSPVTLSVAVDQGGGVTRSFSRQVTMLDNAGGPPEITFNPAQDSHIRSTNPSTNYNSGPDADQLHVKYSWLLPDRVSLLQFDLSGVTVPVENIQSATLELHSAGVPQSNTSTVKVHRLKVDWLENEVTYQERLTGVSWQFNDIDWTPSAQIVVDESVTGWKIWDITTLVKQWLDGTYTNYGLELLSNIGDTNNLEFVSQNSAVVSQRPVLRISYLCECGQPCSTPTTCDPDYTPDSKISEFSTSAYGSGSIKGLTFLPEGKTFNGVAAAAGGAWISVDSATDRIYVTDMTGTLLTSLPTPGPSVTGIARISAGTYVDHFALSDFGGSVYIIDQNGTVVITLSTASVGISNPVDIAFLEKTAGGTYDNGLAILGVNGLVSFTDQTGSSYTTVDYSALTSQVEGLVHLPDTDFLLIVDRGLDQVLKMDFSGSLISSYSISSWSDTAYAISINPETCDHVIGDLALDSVIALNTGGGPVSPVTLNPVADNRIKEGSSTNFGTETYIRVGRQGGSGENVRSILRFDVSSIPAGSVINSATLRLNASSRTGSDSFTLDVHQMTQDWTETGSNWSNADASTPWSGGSGGSYNPTAEASLPAASTGWYEWNVATLVQSWVDGGTSNQGIEIIHTAVAKNNYLDFDSREGTNLPELVIDFTAP